MVSQAGFDADRYRIRAQAHILKDGLLGRTVETCLCLLLLQFGNGLHPQKRKTPRHRHAMKAGCALLLFVVANLLYAIYRTLKDTGLLSSTPASFERWLNS
jgi:hypothetical protein